MNKEPIKLGSRTRLLSLDCLRAFAVILVIIWHGPTKDNRVNSDITFLSNLNFWIGVDLFFVISGFLISNIFFKSIQSHKNLQLKRFYIRRAWKIYPTFYLSLFFFIYFDYLFLWLNLDSLEKILIEIFFLQNYFHSSLGVTWSLAFEEHFYILLPLIFYYSLDSKGNIMVKKFRNIVIFIIIFVILIRNLCLLYDIDRYYLYRMTHCRIDSCFFGVLLAYMRIYHKYVIDLASNLYILIPFGLFNIIIIQSNDYQSPVMITYGYASLSIFFTLLTNFILNCQFPSNILIYSFAKIGESSYIIYLWHIPIYYFMKNTLCLHFKFDGFGLTTPQFFCKLNQ